MRVFNKSSNVFHKIFVRNACGCRKEVSHSRTLPSNDGSVSYFREMEGGDTEKGRNIFPTHARKKVGKGCVCGSPLFFDECMCFVCVRGTRKRHNIALQLERKKTRGKFRISQTKNFVHKNIYNMFTQIDRKCYSKSAYAKYRNEKAAHTGIYNFE